MIRQFCIALPVVFREALKIFSVLILVLGFSVQMAAARNVDLSTVPPRDSVQLTIYNSEDLTLVRETRTVSFKQGLNSLQFSWANTLIDPTSVELRFLSPSDKLEVLDTTFPHDKPQMLYWNIKSGADVQGVVEIIYFTSGITWDADYVGISDQGERHLDLDGFVRVHNRSGEQYEQAQVRLVVGTINLVEKIAQLARVPMPQVAGIKEKHKRELRIRVAKQMMGRSMDMVAEAAPMMMVEEKAIIKEGLSEYFIYTVEGTETIPDGWSKRMRSFSGESVPFTVEYRYRPREYGEQLVRLYVLTNDMDSGLGTTPLPDGQIRVFRGNGSGGLSFLAEQRVKYIPIGDKIELNLGSDPEVVFELVRLKNFRDNIWLRVGKGNKYRRVDGGSLWVDDKSRVAGWDEHGIYAQRVRNYTPKPIRFEVRRSFPGHVEFRSGLKARRHDYQTVEYSSHVPAGKKAELLYEVVQHLGRNSTQNNVTLVERKIKRPSY